MGTIFICIFFSFRFQPGFAAVGLGRQGHGQAHHAAHFLLQQPLHSLLFFLRALHDQLIVHLHDELCRQALPL